MAVICYNRIREVDRTRLGVSRIFLRNKGRGKVIRGSGRVFQSGKTLLAHVENETGTLNGIDMRKLFEERRSRTSGARVYRSAES